VARTAKGWTCRLATCMHACLLAYIHYRLHTLSPTDPVPRGLLTLWARAIAY